MKRILLLLSLVMAMFLPALAVEKTDTLVFADQGYKNGFEVTSTTLTVDNKNVATVTFAQASSASVPKYFSNGAFVRVYSKNTITVKVLNGRTLKGLTLTYGQDPKTTVPNAFSNPTISPTGGTLDAGGDALTWVTQSDTITTFILTPKNSGDISSVILNYEEPANPPLVYSESSVTVDGIPADGKFNQPVLIINTDAPVTYSSSDEDVATVDAEGNVTIHWYGYTKISASSPATSNFRVGEAFYFLNVVDNRKDLTTFKFATTGYRLQVGETGKNALTIAPAEAADLVVYSSSDENIATVTNDGTVTALKDGVCTITASIPSDNTLHYKPVSVSYNLKVNDPSILEETFDFAKFEYGMFRDNGTTYTESTLTSAGDPISIELTKGTSAGFRLYDSGLRIFKGISYMTFKADEGYVITSITYSVAANLGIAIGDNAAVIGTNQSWTGQAPEVKATINSDSEQSVSIRSVKVTYKKVGKLNFNAAEYTTNVGETFTLPTLSSNTDGTLSYSSSDTSVATIDATGKIEIKGVGATTITVKSDATDTYTAGEASFVLNVGEKIRTELTLTFNPASGEVQLHKTLALNLELKAPEGKEINNELFSVVYTSSDDAIATVDENGLVTGVTLGEATITAHIVSPDHDYYANEVTYAVTVVDKRTQVTLAFDPNYDTVKVGGETTLNLNVTAAEGVEFNANEVKNLINYSITPENTSIAEFVMDGDDIVKNEDGQVTVTGLNHGTCTVTATLPAGNENYKPATATFTLKVVDETVPVYELVTSGSDIVPNGQYVLIGKYIQQNEYYGMAGQSGNYRSIEKVSISEDKFELHNTSVVPFTLEASDAKYFIKVNDGYLNFASETAYVTTVASTEGATAAEVKLVANNLVDIYNGTRYLRFNFTNSRMNSASGGSVNGSLYKLPGTGLYAPVMTVEENEITLALNGNGDPNAQIYYTVDGGEATPYTAPFTVSKVGSVVTAYATANGINSTEVSKTITWVKKEFTSLSELFSEATENSNVTLNFELTAIYQHGEYLYVKDSEKYALIKGATTETYTNGAVLAAGSKVTYTKENGQVVLVPVELTAATEGAAVEPTEASVSAVTAANVYAYLNMHPVNVTMDGTLNGTITKGSSSVKLYNQFGLEIETKNNVTVKGFVNVTADGVVFFPTEVFADDADQTPGEVVILLDGETYEAGSYTFPIGTVVTFSADYATKYNVVFGDAESVPVDVDHFTYKVLVTGQGEKIEVTPLNNNVGGEKQPSPTTYTFTLIAELVAPELSVNYKEMNGDIYEVDANTMVTVTCALADKIKYTVDGDNYEEVEGNTLKYNITGDCTLTAFGVYTDDRGSKADSEQVSAQFAIYVPSSEVLNFTANSYGLRNNAAITDSKELIGTYYSFTVNNGVRLYNNNRLRFYEAGDNNEAGAISVNAPAGYVITKIEAGNYTNGTFTPYSSSAASRFKQTLDRTQMSGTLTYVYESTTGTIYYDVQAIRVTIVKAGTLIESETIFNDPLSYFMPTADEYDLLNLWVTKIDDSKCRVVIRVPLTCVLYYKVGTSSSNAPRRAAGQEDGYQQANFFYSVPEQTGDVRAGDFYSFEASTNSTPSVYAYQPASNTKGNAGTFSTQDALAAWDEYITSGVEDITVEGAEEGVYYNLQGLRVVNPGAGVYIRIENGRAVKVRL